ncbi:hypothetical protein OUZ56_019479 [Daphnia magna]|uniref:Uncharacterized protein n=1 Tax=Daphnia magna TaxID=35525 RepID=A0ABQ9ZBP2_9CRUS|nr:hypothetical protein OUZ56_019479 [Daphnia magna]
MSEECRYLIATEESRSFARWKNSTNKLELEVKRILGCAKVVSGYQCPVGEYFRVGVPKMRATRLRA